MGDPGHIEQDDTSQATGSDAGPGRVALVGGGPGDPGLITVRGARLLARATAVLYDDLLGSDLLDRIPPGAIRVYVGKRAGRAAMTQEEIQAELIRLARAGHRVVRLKGGDPLVFGRGLEELRACAEAGVVAELVPGVSSALAAPAYAGIAPTLRGVASAVTVVTGHEDPQKEESSLDWDALARIPGTLVILMGMGRLRQIVGALLLGGRPGGTPAAVVQWGTLGRQRELFSTLNGLCGAVERSGISSPAVIVVGEAAAESERIDWLRRARPHLGLRVADTRHGAVAAELRDVAMDHGVEVASRPLLETTGLSAGEIAEMAPEALTGRAGGHVVWGSAAAVRHWARAMGGRGLDGRAMAGRRLACVGRAAAEALRAEAGLIPDVVASGGALVLPSLGGDGGAATALIIRGDAPVDWADGLASAGWRVCQTVVCRTKRDAMMARRLVGEVVAGEWAAVVVSSVAAVDVLERACLEAGLTAKPDVAVITAGPRTTERARAAGWNVVFEAAEPTAHGLWRAVDSCAKTLVKREKPRHFE